MRLSKVRDRQRAVYRLQTFSLKNIDQVIQANFPKWRTVSSSCVAVSSEWKHYLQEGGERCNKTPEANKTEKAQKAHESYKIHKAPSQACKSWGIETLPPASCAGSPRDTAFLSCHPYGSGFFSGSFVAPMLLLVTSTVLLVPQTRQGGGIISLVCHGYPIWNEQTFVPI